MNKKVVLILIISVSFFTCKKKDNTPAPAPAPSQNGGGNPSGVTSSNATQFYGIFATGNYTTDLGGGNIFSSTNAHAYFSNAPEPAIYAASAVMVNSVYLNGDSLTYYPSYKYYIPLNLVNLSSETWSVNGANGIGTFNYTNNSTTPSFAPSGNLPDSISKSAGFSVNINNVSNTTSASFLVYDGSNTPTGYFSAGLNAGNNTVTITPANLSSLSTTTSGYLIIIMANKKAISYSGKDYQFSREAQYSKHIKINP